MAEQYSSLILLIPLGVMIPADFRTREVSLLWLLVFSALTVVISLYHNGICGMLNKVALNLLLLAYLAVSILVYLRIKHGKWLNPLNRYVGSGDLVFLVGLTPLFGLREYLVFIIAALVFSLLWALGIRILCRKDGTVPIIATMGISLCITLIAQPFI